MKSKNIPADFKSKSIKEAKDEINEILNKLEKNDANLEGSVGEYQKLILLNNHVNDLFKKRLKEISTVEKSKKKIKK